jgi:TolB protein
VSQRLGSVNGAIKKALRSPNSEEMAMNALRVRITLLSGALILLAAAATAAPSVASERGARGTIDQHAGRCDPPCFHLESTLAFTSTRDHLNEPPALGGEVYLANPDMTNPRRLTDNSAFDGFGALSPDGKKIVFDSTRYTGSLNSSDLFLMNTDGTEQTLLLHGSSATWSPDSKNIAFHASASGNGTPLRTDPGSATSDSDIFVVNVDDLLAGTEQPRNLTKSQDKIDDDAAWSPDGQKIAYTAHDVGDEGPNWPLRPFISNSAEIYVRNADGTGAPVRLTQNDEEERGVSWSPDGSQIAFMCRAGGGAADFEICLMNADGSGRVQLTDNSVFDGTPTFSPDGQQILFHRTVGGPGSGNQQLFVMNSRLNADGTPPTAVQLTFGTPTSGDGINNLANWGELRVHG